MSLWKDKRSASFGNEKFDDAEGRMLANDPTADNISVNMAKATYLVVGKRLGRALYQTTHVKRLSISLDMHKFEVDENERRDDQDALLLIFQWITTSTTLEELDLYGNYNDVRGIADELMPWFLRAITNRQHFSLAPLRFVKIFNIDMQASQFAELVKSCELQRLITYNCNFLRSNGKDIRANHISQVAEAFRANSSLRRLTLSSTERNASCVAAIIDALSAHVHLQELTISRDLVDSVGYCHDEVCRALAKFLATGKCPLRSIHLKWIRWKGNSLSAIINSLQISDMDIDEIGFDQCVFEHATIMLLGLLFDGTNSIHRLKLFKNYNMFDEQELTNIVGTAVGLKEIHMDNSYGCSTAIFMGLKLKTCSVHTVVIESQFDCAALVEVLPYVQSLKHLELKLWKPALKERFMSALKRNSSLLTTTIHGDVLSPRDVRLLQAYQIRNAKIPEMLRTTSKPSNVLSLLFPRVLCASIDSTRDLLGVRQSFASLVRRKDLVGLLQSTTCDSRHKGATWSCSVASRNKRVRRGQP